MMLAQIDRNFTKLSLKKTYTRLLAYAFYEGRPLTTKGRWINPLVFFLFKLQSVLPFGKCVEKPIFILGVGRSGTTILGVTLGMHSDVGFLNEPKALWSYLSDKDDLIGSYNDNEGNYRLTAADTDQLIIKKAHRIYGWFLRLGCASRIVDKYPELVFRTDFVKAIFPDARFLFLYRNGNDTCHSIRKWSERLGTREEGEIHDWWGKDDRKWKLLCDQIVTYDDVLFRHVDEIRQFTDHEFRAAVEWVVTMKEGIKLINNMPDCVVGVKYEKYVNDVDERNKVLKFCDLFPDVLFDNYCEVVLKEPTMKPELELPLIIKGEFQRVMKQLGYE